MSERRQRKSSARATKRAKSKKSTAPLGLEKSRSAARELNDPGQSGRSVPPWEPEPKQVAYLWALRDAMVPGTGDGITSDTGMAKKIKVSRTLIWEWKHDPQFNAWMRLEMRGDEYEHEWDLILSKHAQLAIRGSVRSAEFLGRLRTVGQRGGGFNEGGDVIDQSVTNYTVVSLVPRPPALPEKTVGGGQA